VSRLVGMKGGMAVLLVKERKRDLRYNHFISSPIFIYFVFFWGFISFVSFCFWSRE